jgi:hypothetical protein
LKTAPLLHHRGNIYFCIHIGEYYSDICPDRIGKTPRLEKLKRRITVHDKIRVPPVPVARFWLRLSQKTTVYSITRKGMPNGRFSARNGDILSNNTFQNNGL